MTYMFLISIISSLHTQFLDIEYIEAVKDIEENRYSL